MLSKKERRKIRRKHAEINSKLKKNLFGNLLISPCIYCKYVFLIDNLTIEHLIPRSYGGSDDKENIALACAPCNQERGRESWKKRKNIVDLVKLKNHILLNEKNV